MKLSKVKALAVGTGAAATVAVTTAYSGGLLDTAAAESIPACHPVDTSHQCLAVTNTTDTDVAVQVVYEGPPPGNQATNKSCVPVRAGKQEFRNAGDEMERGMLYLLEVHAYSPDCKGRLLHTSWGDNTVQKTDYFWYTVKRLG